MGEPDRPLRVLHLTAGSDAGGVSRYLWDLCRHLPQHGVTPMIAGERGAWHDLFENGPCRWLDAPLKGGPVALRRSVGPLLRQVCPLGVDLIHAHYRKASLVGRWLARRLGVPLLFTLHLTGIPMTGFWRWFSDFGDHSHVPSQDARQWLIDVGRVPSDRVTVIPHGVDGSCFPLADAATRSAARAALSIPASDRLLAFVGRFDEPKNETWVVDAAAAAQRAGVPVRAILMGEGPRRDALQTAVRRCGLTDRILVLGYGDPLPVYQACDLLVLPSSREGFSLVGLEAMSVGRAVLRTRTAGTAEQIIEHVTGVSTPIDHDAFVAAAVAMLHTPDRLAVMGQAAARHVRERLQLSEQVRRTAMLYSDLVSDGPHPGGRCRSGG